jgi:hypothetical protein
LKSKDKITVFSSADSLCASAIWITICLWKRN